MSSINRVEVSFQKRNTKGLDAYEHEQASVTAVLALDEGDDPSGQLEKVGDEVRSHVRRLLGLTSKAEAVSGNVQTTVDEAPERPEKTPTGEAREKPAPSHPAEAPETGPNDRIRQAQQDAAQTGGTSTPILPTQEGKVKGQNAQNLAEQLKVCVRAGIEVPETQLARLPKGWRQEVEKVIDNEGGQEPQGSHDDPFFFGIDADAGAEPQGSHDDPPVSGPDVDAAESTDPGENAELDEKELKRQDDEQTEAKKAAAGGDDDIMAELEQELEPQNEDISDEHLKAQLRDAASKAGSPQAVMPAVREYTTDGKSLSTIPQTQRKAFLEAVWSLVNHGKMHP